MKKSVSVWCVGGRPKLNNSVGAVRSGMFLLPMTAEAGEAMMAFIDAAKRTDGVEYDAADINEVRYCGWAWLPECD